MDYPSNGVSEFPSLTFQDLVNADDEGESVPNLGFVRLEQLPESLTALAEPATALTNPNSVVLTPTRSRIRTKTPGGSIKWRSLPMSPGDKDEDTDMNGEGSSAGQEEDKEYDPDSSIGSEGAKENASPTRSADFAKRLTLKTPKRRSRGERNAEVEIKYGRIQNPDKIKVIKARIKDMLEKQDTHKEKVKRDRPSAKEVKDQAKGKVSLESPKKAIPEKTYACDVCQKTFGSKGTLKQHSKAHAEPVTLHCVPCDKTFKTAETFATHQRLHQPDNPFICTTCLKAFTSKQSFDRHIQVHETPKGSKPYACPTCYMSYASKVTLSRHINKLKHGTKADEDES